MNFKDLRYFQKLSEEKSFSETAKFFKVSQPTITYALKRLESEYGVMLVERKSYANSLQLTPAGIQLQQHIQRILHEDQLISHDLQRIKSRQIKVGLPPIITNYLFPKVFSSLRREKLLRTIEPVVNGSHKLEQLLQAGQLDISLLGSTSLPRDPNLSYQIIRAHQFKLIASIDHHFKMPLDIADLAKEDFILLDEQSVHQQVFQYFTQKCQVVPNVIYQTSEYRLLLDLVKQNQGISFITETAILGEGGIQQLPIPNLQLPPFYLLLVYRNSSLPDPQLQQLINIFSTIPFL